MHELAITRSIIAIAREAAGARMLKAINVDIGTQSGIMADAVAFCFSSIAPELGMSEVRLNINSIAAEGECSACGAIFPMATGFASCPCGARGGPPVRGQELKVRSIEMEEVN